MNHPDLLLAIESSCDETAAAVVDRELRVLSNVVQSQDELHRQFGGVVPEVASRAHVRRIIPAIDEALRAAGVGLDDLSAIAVTSRPGLVGSLLVGLTAAKTLSLVLEIPLVDVNHVEAHLFACQMSAGRPVFSAIGLVVSGGHTLALRLSFGRRARNSRFHDRRRGRRSLRQGGQAAWARVSWRTGD